MAEISIYQVNGKVEGLWEQLKLGVHTDDPINEDGPDILINISLVTHVKAVRLSVLLCQLHVRLDVPAVQANVVNVTQCCLVNLCHLRSHIVLNTLLICSQLGVEAYLRQFVTRAKTR